jgi:hypothetical protein
MQCPNEKTEQVKGIVARLIEEWAEKKYHGSIQLNFNAGSVPNINVNRSIRLLETK